MNSAVETVIAGARAALGKKGVTTDSHDIAPWLVDWRGIYRGQASAILSPASTSEVAQIVRLAATYRVPLVIQGGNTSMVGGATPPDAPGALILSLRRMSTVRRIDARAGIAIAEAGTILTNFHDAVAQQGARFPLTLGAKGSATIGGLVSTNAGGTQVLRFGTMRAQVLGLEAVMPDGRIWHGLDVLKKDNRGYDINQLLVGAEGTLGIVTAAALRIVPAIADRAVGWLAVASPAAALAALRAMEGRSGNAIESFEIVPADTMQLVLRHIPGTRAPLAAMPPWLVLVEYVGEDASARLETLIAATIDDGDAHDAVIAQSEAQAETFWHLRDAISEAERAEGPTLAHDISVPVDAMPAFMTDAARAVEARFPGTIANAFGHLGDGNVHFHVRPSGPVEAVAWKRDVGRDATRMVYDLVTAAGGSISAEHGIGQMKRDELLRLSDPVRINVLHAIKGAIDPLGIMNPGKLI